MAAWFEAQHREIFAELAQVIDCFAIMSGLPITATMLDPTLLFRAIRVCLPTRRQL
jgi:hypothetical protein